MIPSFRFRGEQRAGVKAENLPSPLAARCRLLTADNIERRRRTPPSEEGMGVSGQMALVGLMEWLQVLELNRRTVHLRFRRGGKAGAMRFVRGRLVEARSGVGAGDDAARELLTWLDAHFEQQPSRDESPGDVTRTNYDLMIEAVERASGDARNALGDVAGEPADGEPGLVDPHWRVTGDLDVTSLVELLQLGEMNRRRMALRIQAEMREKGDTPHFPPKAARRVLRRNEECPLFRAEALFDAGRIVSARAGRIENADAVYAMLGVEHGQFEVFPLIEPPATTFIGDVQGLLMEGVRRADEERMLRGEPVPDPDPTSTQLLRELAAGVISPAVRLAMAKRYQPRGEATPVPVLLRLAEDNDLGVRRAANESLDRLPLTIRRTLAVDPQVKTEVRERLAAQVAKARPEDDALPSDAEYPRGMHGRIHSLTMADKVFLANRGTRNERLVLMRHPSRRVALAAFESARTTETDVEAIARSTSANVDVLSAITRDPRYNGKYGIVRALVLNPKTPASEAVRLVPRLREADVRAAWRDPDLSDPVRAALQKRMTAIAVKRTF
jgi:hypothetical protein